MTSSSSSSYTLARNFHSFPLVRDISSAYPSHLVRHASAPAPPIVHAPPVRVAAGTVAVSAAAAAAVLRRAGLLLLFRGGRSPLTLIVCVWCRDNRAAHKKKNRGEMILMRSNNPCMALIVPLYWGGQYEGSDIFLRDIFCTAESLHLILHGSTSGG